MVGKELVVCFGTEMMDHDARRAYKVDDEIGYEYAAIVSWWSVLGYSK
jgi:hypothetical protein